MAPLTLETFAHNLAITIQTMNMNPTSWNASDVEAWARQVGLSETTIAALCENENDGSTLVTLEKEELRLELGVVSLPARSYLLDLILMLCSHQDSSDRAIAIDFLEEEIDRLPTQGITDASAGGWSEVTTDEGVVNELRKDAAQQRQIMSDHLMALRLQSTRGQQTYEDAELARAEEERLRSLAVQSEFDRRYAQSLGQRGRDRSGINNNQIASLFGLSIQACVSNKVNVAGEKSRLHS